MYFTEKSRLCMRSISGVSLKSWTTSANGARKNHVDFNGLGSRWTAWMGTCLVALTSFGVISPALADVRVPNVFSDHMVLQRGQENRVWGRGEVGEKVTATIGGQSVSTQAGADGAWMLMLPKMEAGGPHQLSIKGNNEIVLKDILVGEVWVCSGQSNMRWPVKQSNDADIESLTANYPKIRMINFPNVGTQEPIWSHDAQWKVCSPETVGDFSAVGYFFGRQLYETIEVPIGLINNSWGGSAAEAWVDGKDLEADPDFKKLMAEWDAAVEKSEAQLAFELASNGDKKEEASKKKIADLQKQLSGNQRPGNIYNGVLKSHLGYGIKGAIWYQGESNAGRAYKYRKLFPLMIQKWREEWGQGDFPFYFVQLADYLAESDQPMDSNWAELREAQTMTMDSVPHTGQAVIIDIGEGKDIHPKNKVDVAKRLARWALANEYGVNVSFRSPQYESMQVVGNKIALKFAHLSDGWRPFDVKEPQGFQIAGEDKKFVWATAVIQPDNTIHVSAAEVSNPVAVRYAWSNNPRCNMYANSGLPLTPFRTDDWPGVTVSADGK